jgi:hypothetical protein
MMTYVMSTAPTIVTSTISAIGVCTLLEVLIGFIDVDDRPAAQASLLVYVSLSDVVIHKLRLDPSKLAVLTRTKLRCFLVEVSLCHEHSFRVLRGLLLDVELELLVDGHSKVDTGV